MPKRKKLNPVLKSLIVFIIGLTLFFYGIYQYFFTQPYASLSIAFLQPVMVNGSLMLIIGSGFIIGSIIIFKRRK